MNFDFLPYVIPAIVLVGWAIGLIQANRKDGTTPLPLYTIIMTIYSIALIVNFVAMFNNQAHWMLPGSNFALALSSFSLATHFYNKRDRFGTSIFVSVAIFQGILFLTNL